MRHHQQYPRKQQTNKINLNDQDTYTSLEEDQFSANISYRKDSLVDYLSDDESDSEMPNGCKLEISNPVREIVCQMLDNYLNDDKITTELEFPSSLLCHERLFVRQQAQQRNLLCRTIVRGACRLITVSKFPTEAISSNSSNQLPKQFTFSLNNNQLIQDMNTYLQTFPISSEENDLLQAKIQKTPASLNDWFYCALFRSGNPLCQSSDSKARIPDETFLSHEYFLPIDQTSTRENLIHLIETNKILFVNGPPAIGKSLRISQYINNEYSDKQWPIRILHSCSNNLSANALASRFAQPIDCFTFENMSTTQWTSLITVTTHEFLLHTLISGDFLLKFSLTHLIIDDVHKRSHTLDMLLAYLKDSQAKFRYLKIIFIQSNVQYDTLTKYFGNVPTYTIEIKSDEIEEKFLDDILIDVERIDQNHCLSIATLGLELLNHWCYLAEQASHHHGKFTSIYPESLQHLSRLEENLSTTEKFLNNLLARCFINGFIEDFQILQNYLLDNRDQCNYQHSLTLLTPLMCFSMWSIQDGIQQLLASDNLLMNLRCVKNYSAIDFARKYATNEVIDLLESSIVSDSFVLEQILCLKNSNPTRNYLMKSYLQTRKSNNIIDYELIFNIIRHICQRQVQNHVLIFLPGCDEIFKMKEFIENSTEFKIEICVILTSSSWQMINTTQSRLVILCDANCETGVPFHTINSIIDTGIVFEKKYSWINQISANERKSRAKIGICYRVYPRDLFGEKINENIHSEMARQPLLENIMQAKLFAWTNCSVAEFMLKLPYPPPFATVRAGITQLKNLDLFDKWEDLVDLGAYCLALPIVELRYAMMIVYAYFFKCIEPILIIISTLTIGDPFQSTANKEILLNIKEQFSNQQYSDHYIFYRLYQQWTQSVNKKDFCQKFHLKYFRMEQINTFKTFVTNFLNHKNFSKYFYSNEIVDLDENSTCWPLIQAILLRCLPHNLLTYDQHWLTTRNELVNFDCNSILTRLYLSNESKLHFAICDQLIHSSKGLFISQYSSLIDDIVLILFGFIQDYETILIDNNNKNLLKLRTKFQACLKRKLQSLGCDELTKNQYDLMNLLVRIVSSNVNELSL